MLRRIPLTATLLACVTATLGAQERLVRRVSVVSEFPPSVRVIDDRQLYGGRVHAISVNPADGNRVIISAEWGGLWRTENNGTSWMHVDGLDAVNTRDVVYSPDGATIIATNRRDTRVANGGGIYVSKDGGRSWTRPASAIPPMSPRVTRRISAHGVSWASSTKAYVGTDFGLAVTLDAGLTWTHRSLGDFGNVDGDSLQNAVFSVQALPGNGVLATSRRGLFQSGDAGLTWARLSQENFDWFSEFHMFAMWPTDSTKVLVLRTHDQLLLLDLANGVNSPITINPGQFDGGRGNFVRISKAPTPGAFMVWISVSGDDWALTCADVNCLTSAGASSWVRFGRDKGFHDDGGDLAVGPDGFPAFHGSDGGLVRPTDAAFTRWIPAARNETGFNSFQISSLAGTNIREADGRFNAALYFTTQDNFIWATPDSTGQVWRDDCPEGFLAEAVHKTEVGRPLTAVWGTIGCGARKTSNDVLLTKREIPNRGLLNEDLGPMSLPAFIRENQWVRLRETTPPELWVSGDNLEHWWKMADLSLETRSQLRAAADESGVAAYVAVKTSRSRRGGGEIIGLMKFTDILGATERSYSEADVIFLPDSGSLDQSFRMFGSEAVFGVDPHNGAIIIAADVVNQVMKVSRNSGQTWDTDVALTKLVTRNGSLLIFDRDINRMEVTIIRYDPEDTRHVLVGTREGGVIESFDRGLTWRRIPGTDEITVITGFFFQQGGSIYVSSYGRGLFKISQTDAFVVADLGGAVVDLCRLSLLCRLGELAPIDTPHIRRPELTERIIVQPSRRVLGADEALMVVGGRIVGAALTANRLSSVTVTPGSRVLTFSTKGATAVKVAESATGEFGALADRMPKIADGMLLTGLLLTRGNIIGVSASPDELRPDLPEQLRTPKRRTMVPAQPLPYLLVHSTGFGPGIAGVGADRRLRMSARGFENDPASPLRLFVDDKPVAVSGKPGKAGYLELDALVPEHLSRGLHTILVTQSVRGRERVARSAFMTGPQDGR